jgi:hypothetical protein
MDTIFDELAFIRTQTLQAIEGVTEELADRIPTGFRNHIRWQLGHIYISTEILAFSQLNLPIHLPEGCKALFAPGTSPSDDIANTVPVPTLAQLASLLEEQPARVKEAMLGRDLNESVPPKTTSTGLVLRTPGQSLRSLLYHEGYHCGILSVYKRLL